MGPRQPNLFCKHQLPVLNKNSSSTFHGIAGETQLGCLRLPINCTACLRQLLDKVIEVLLSRVFTLLYLWYFSFAYQECVCSLLDIQTHMRVIESSDSDRTAAQRTHRERNSCFIDRFDILEEIERNNSTSLYRTYLFPSRSHSPAGLPVAAGILSLSSIFIVKSLVSRYDRKKKTKIFEYSCFKPVIHKNFSRLMTFFCDDAFSTPSVQYIHVVIKPSRCMGPEKLLMIASRKLYTTQLFCMPTPFLLTMYQN